MTNERKTPQQRRAVILTALSLAGVAIGIYIAFIMMTAAR